MKGWKVRSRVHACGVIVQPLVSTLLRDPGVLPCIAQRYCTSHSIRHEHTGPKTTNACCLRLSWEQFQSRACSNCFFYFTLPSCFVRFKCRSQRSVIYRCFFFLLFFFYQTIKLTFLPFLYLRWKFEYPPASVCSVDNVLRSAFFKLTCD